MQTLSFLEFYLAEVGMKCVKVVLGTKLLRKVIPVIESMKRNYTQCCAREVKKPF